MKKIMSAFVALVMSASVASATCSAFVSTGFGQNLVNYCNYAVIVEWSTSHGACSTGQRCAAVVEGGSSISTSNPSDASWQLWECVYSDWVNGYCQF